MFKTDDDLSKIIPYYLTAEQTVGLKEELEKFRNTATRNGINYYTTRIDKAEMLQGDVWDSLNICNIETTPPLVKPVKGIILSNTCDISPENPRDLPTRFLFSPIIKLSTYSTLLQRSGLESKKIDSKIDAIRRQDITSIFYLPKSYPLEDEYIAQLDDVHTLKLEKYLQIQNRSKQFSLSMTGFYLFILKLSIHLCRFHEGVDRDGTALTHVAQSSALH